MPSPGGSLSPAVRRRAQVKSPESSPDPSPARIAWTTRRRLWSPPPRPKSRKPSSPLARSSASSMIPRHALAAPLQSVVVKTPLEPDTPRSRRAHHRGRFPPRPPSKSASQDDAAGLESAQHLQPPRDVSPPRLRASPSVPSVVVDRRRPPPTRHGSRGSCSTASSIMKTVRARVQAKPPSLANVSHINRKLATLALE